MSIDPGPGPAAWPEKYPWRFLPRTGTHPFRPPPFANWLRNPPRGRNKGYLDEDGNEWVPHRDPGGDPEEMHWDVQHANGSHTNVRLEW
jgi:hypothetical protein